MKKIAVFSSARGSNASNLFAYFKGHPYIRVGMLVSDSPGCGALERAERSGIPTLLAEKSGNDFETRIPAILKEAGIELLVLAGFFSLLPPRMIEAFPGRIINIHPSLLPRYGGKGFYGDIPLRRALEAGENVTGISIHFVDEIYDHGEVIFRKSCPIDWYETPLSLAYKIKQLEFTYLPLIIEKLLLPEYQPMFIQD